MQSSWMKGLDWELLALLAGCRTPDMQDFVSGYDFQNAQLEDLPNKKSKVEIPAGR